MKHASLLLLIFSIGFALSANAQFFEEDHLVTDVRSNVTWLRCSVGQTWDLEDKTCDGSIVKLNHDQIKNAIEQASNQLGGRVAITNARGARGIGMRDVRPPKVKQKYFPNISPEAYWTSKPNFWNRKMYWTVNFMTGHKYSRFFAYQELPVLLVRDR